ncbi:MAG: hypothetical protein A2Y17_00765 [Clostridiales bacterium GWF2_38_85]|nr:MAG: hypothetical protein A2Y17_00765 [Clostridiales bacterium GWF2_38_85]
MSSYNGYDTFNEFLVAPDTVDFIVQNSEYFLEYIKDKPYIYPTFSLIGEYLVAYTSKEKIEKVSQELGSAFIAAESTVLGLLDHQALEAAGIIQVIQQPFLNLRGQGVLIGIIDTGIDYTKDVFKYEDGTSKIVGIFDQTFGHSLPYGFMLGTEYTQEQINQALKSDDPYSIVPQKDTVGHGTFLASIAAGREVDDFIGAAPDAELLIVKLKKARPYYLEKYLIPPEQDNAYESSAVMVGIEYIVKKSEELGRPAVICLGIGTSFGSHDGYSLFEDYLSDISKLTGICICTSVGNESQAKHHFFGKMIKQGEEQNVELRVGDNASDIYISMWNNASDRISVAIRSPTGELITRIPAKSGVKFEAKLVFEKATVIVEYYFPSRGSGSQRTVIKLINATRGIWNIIVRGDIILNGEYHAWLPITGFISPNVEFLLPNPYTTVVIPSTALGPISCGSYNSFDNSLYSQTSWGPTRLPMMAPDFVAPGVDIGGVYPEGYGTMNGTSVSTAITSGACALMMQWGIIEKNDIALSTYQIKAYLIRGCSRSPETIYPNLQWGYGRLNLLQSFISMRET